MIHYLLTLTPAQDLKTKALDKGWRCWCVSCASPSCPCPHTPCEPSLLPSLLSSDSWEHLLALSQPSSQHWISSLPLLSALQSILPFQPFHGKFPLPFSQSTTIPWAVTGCLHGGSTFWALLCHICGVHAFSPLSPRASMAADTDPLSVLHQTGLCSHPDGMISSSASGEHCSLLLWPLWLFQWHWQSSTSRCVAEDLCSVHGTGHAPPSCPLRWVWGTLPNSPMQPGAVVTVLPAGELTGSNLGTDSSAPWRSKGGFRLGSSPSTPPHCHPLLSKEAAWGCT